MTDDHVQPSTSALLRFSIATADASTLTEIAALLSKTAAPLVGAANTAVSVVAKPRNSLQIFQGPTATAGNAPIRMLDLNEPTPMTDAIRNRSPVFVESEEQFAARYPRIARRTQPGDVTAMAAYPLELDGEALGGCFFRFAEGRTLNEDRLRLMAQMLPLLARGIARIQDRAELVAYAHRLEQSNRDLDNFAAIVAHDLSAPVRRIGSYMQLLEREIRPLTETAERYAGIIGDQARHLDALLRDTLAYAQIAAPTDTHREVRLDGAVNAILEPLRPELERHNASVVVGELPVVDIEETLVRQVFANLFDNAIKYRHQDRNPMIEVQADPEPHGTGDARRWWKVRFADNGIGIDPARHDEVFAMFARLESTRDRPGTGVGLAFVKRVVERHGGTVGIEPTANGGTTFWFTLPGPIEPDVL